MFTKIIFTLFFCCNFLYEAYADHGSRAAARAMTRARRSHEAKGTSTHHHRSHYTGSHHHTSHYNSPHSKHYYISRGIFQSTHPNKQTINDPTKNTAGIFSRIKNASELIMGEFTCQTKCTQQLACKTAPWIGFMLRESGYYINNDSEIEKLFSFIRSANKYTPIRSERTEITKNFRELQKMIEDDVQQMYHNEIKSPIGRETPSELKRMKEIARNAMEEIAKHESIFDERKSELDAYEKEIFDKDYEDITTSIKCLRNCNALTNMRYACKMMEYMDISSAPYYHIILGEEKAEAFKSNNKGNRMCLIRRDETTSAEELDAKFHAFQQLP